MTAQKRNQWGKGELSIKKMNMTLLRNELIPVAEKIHSSSSNDGYLRWLLTAP